MLQNRTISSSISSPVSTELADSLERTLTNERLHVIRRTLSLPDSPQSFLVFLLLLLLLGGALTLHLTVSTAIYKSELQLVALQARHLALEQESTILIEQIAESSTLPAGVARAAAQGYVPAYDRRYIVQNTGSTAPATLLPTPPARTVLAPQD